MIPTYIISRCPICHIPYQQAVDIYSLYLWNILHNADSVTYSPQGYERCEHFIGVHSFLNLNQRLPSKTELRNKTLYSTEPEVPIITPTLLPDDIESYAVLHSLPICQPWGKRFLPRYILFMLTYYSTNRQALELRRLKEWIGGEEVIELPKAGVRWAHGHKRLMIYWEEANTKPEARDLFYWVKKGKLRWLNLLTPDLSLNTGDTEFPYLGISGRATGLQYQEKKLEVVNTHPTIEEFRENLRRYRLSSL
jgi:hypothetical protein